MFPIEQFLTAKNIQFTPGSSKGVNVCCPYCPGGDTGYNCGIFYDGTNYHCWKCGARGHQFTLFQDLTGISYQEYQWYVDTQDPFNGLTIAEAIKLKLHKKSSSAELIEDRMPPEAIPISPQILQTFPWISRYLATRNLPFDVYTSYGAHICLSGRYANRIVAPVVFRKKLVGYQGRDMTCNPNVPKYLASDDLHTKLLLYNYDRFVGGPLVLIEGFFDCWTLGDNAVGAFKSVISAEQRALLWELRPSRLYIAFDPDVWGAQDKVKNILESADTLSSFFPVHLVKFPTGYDPNKLGTQLAWQYILATPQYR